MFWCSEFVLMFRVTSVTFDIFPVRFEKMAHDNGAWSCLRQMLGKDHLWQAKSIYMQIMTWTITERRERGYEWGLLNYLM